MFGFFDWFFGRKTARRDYCVFGVSYTGKGDKERCGLTEQEAVALFRAARAQAKRTGDANVVSVERNGKMLRCPYWEDDRPDRNCG